MKTARARHASELQMPHLLIFPVADSFLDTIDEIKYYGCIREVFDYPATKDAKPPEVLGALFWYPLLISDHLSTRQNYTSGNVRQ